MKFVLIIVFLPGFVSQGTEEHIDFPTYEMCLEAQKNVNLGDRGGYAICVTKDAEAWFYEDLK